MEDNVKKVLFDLFEIGYIIGRNNYKHDVCKRDDYEAKKCFNDLERLAMSYNVETDSYDNGGTERIWENADNLGYSIATQIIDVIDECWRYRNES